MLGGMEMNYFPSVSSLYTEELMLALKEDQIEALFSIYQISRKGKKNVSLNLLICKYILLCASFYHPMQCLIRPVYFVI
jgi:hypothetical protein